MWDIGNPKIPKIFVNHGVKSHIRAVKKAIKENVIFTLPNPFKRFIKGAEKDTIRDEIAKI